MSTGFGVVALAAAMAAMLYGCTKAEPEPVTESFPANLCTYAPSGLKSVRKWEQCHQVGKNSCANKTKHETPNEEWVITCRKGIWQDQSVAKLPGYQPEKK